MIEIKYVSSDGKEYSLVGDRMRATDGYFHEYKWTPSEAKLKNGVEVYDFTKEPVSYEITLTIRGTLEERKGFIDRLTDSFEYDIVNVKPGRIYFGNYYIECYIQESRNKVSSLRNNWTDCEVNIYCPYPFWAMEQTKNFYPSEANKGENYAFLDYPKGYKYDYSRTKTGVEHWNVDHYRNSNFKMVIYGPCANPRITIGGKVYQVHDTLEKGEYVVIDSRNRTVTKHLVNGTSQNIFYKKGMENSIFEMIPPGDLLINWSGEFGFEITIYKERSVPRWNS